MILVETEIQMPFGRTDVTFDELMGLVDIDLAIKHARKAGVTDADSRIYTLIKHLPSLLDWLQKNGRRFPWRETTDPWRIYITEILLQRTRADEVDKIYEDFFVNFPTANAIADSPESEIRNMVFSLGFVNHRTRTLYEAADLCIEQGSVPESLEELKRPWRVGEYSARACQMFSRGEPLALVDANFSRVIERVLGYDMPNQPHKSDEFYDFLGALVPSEPALARAFNLALLDLGALICKPQNPACNVCPINTACYYYQHNRSES